MERVLVTTENNEQEAMIESIYHILSKKENVQHVEKSAVFLKLIKERIEEIQLIQPYLISEIQQMIQSIQWQTGKLEIQTDFINRRFRSRLYLMQVSLSIVSLLFGLPVFIFGFIHNIVPFYLTDKLIPKLTKHVEYYAAMAVLLGLVFYPLTYIAFLYGLERLFEPTFWVKLIYFISMPLTGMFAYTFVRWLKRIGHKWKYIFMIFTKKEALKELQLTQKKLEKLLFP